MGKIRFVDPLNIPRISVHSKKIAEQMFRSYKFGGGSLDWFCHLDDDASAFEPTQSIPDQP
jgi:hypothetical protein